MIAAIANTAWWASCTPAHRALRAALQDPERAQVTLLREMLRQNAATAFGREHGFRDVTSYESFARSVPLRDYDELVPWIDRIAAGEADVLTAGPVERLVPSGGSTRAKKLVPYTSPLRRQFRQAIGAWIHDLYGARPSLRRGCAYWSITPVATGAEMWAGRSVPIGFDEDSAYLGRATRWLVDATMAVPPTVRLIADVEAFRYVTVLFLLRRRDLRLISVWHPSFLLFLLDAMRAHWPALLRDVRDGTCRPKGDVPGDVVMAFAGYWSPAPARAAELEYADPQDPRSIWPGLGLVSCWADAHAALPARALADAMPGVEVQPKGLIATEAFVTLPFANGWPLAVTSHFSEFVDEHGAVHPAWGLAEGGVYSVAVTTAGGLWRYRLHDRVRVEGFVGRTPSLRFIGKADHVSDLFGEKLSEGFVGEVLRELLARLPRPPTFAMLAPDESAAGPCYTLYVDADQHLPPTDRLDRLLRANPHYEYCRRLGQLAAPRVFRILGSGAFERFTERGRRKGQRLGDIKAAALSAEAGWSRVFEGTYVDATGADR